jgi:hypothetical protein
MCTKCQRHEQDGRNGKKVPCDMKLALGMKIASRFTSTKHGISSGPGRLDQSADSLIELLGMSAIASKDPVAVDEEKPRASWESGPLGPET